MKTLALREKDLDTLRRTFRRFPCVREVRVFGSRATGTARRASDIDLAILAPDATAAEWQKLTEALEEAPIIYEFDLVRPEQTANPRLLEKIAREGVSIYPEIAPEQTAREP
ncbi:MAG: nucleotidyltransferase domain-containing protein [Verrucomicrobiota bacterium]